MEATGKLQYIKKVKLYLEQTTKTRGAGGGGNV
jgi:hypothetical protein